MPPRKDLGSLLVDENVIGGKDLERVDRKGRPLWHALLEARLTSEDELYFVMAKRYGAPVLAESEIAEAQLPPNENVRRALAREQALEAGMLPIDVAPDGRRCTVVMVDPSDEASLAAFLVRAQIPEGRAVLGRRSAIEQAIDRVYQGARNVSQRVLTSGPVSYHHDEVTGTVKLDPSLAAELAQLPPRMTKPEPMPEKRAQKKKPSESAPSPSDDKKIAAPDAVAEERFSRALIQAVEVLVRELEQRLGGASGSSTEQSGLHRLGTAKEMGRLARRVAKQLGLPRRVCDEIGVTAELYAIDALIKKNDGVASEIFGELGWPAAGEGGMVPILRALTASSAGFGRVQGQSARETPLGARIIAVIADYLELGAAAQETQLETVSQLLRASSAGAPVVDALLRVLETDRDGDLPAQKTIVTTTVTHAAPAHSLLKEMPDTPTPPTAAAVEDSTQKKLVPPPRRPQKE